jgi:hypothetical protein
MDRQIVYIDANPLDTDQLSQSKNTMIGLGMLTQALLGTSTLFDGLACAPTAPASLQVIVSPGSIYSLENVDNTAYGSLAADESHQIMKQGISLGPVTLNCPPPGTAGYSVNYLIQAIYQDTDTGATVLPYFNSDAPDVAFNGPGGLGASQNTVREGQCIISAKAGVAAATGSQTTPAPDAGYTGLWVVTVANTQTQIISGNISEVSGAPFISEKLDDKISIPTGDARYLRLGTGIRTMLTANTTFYISTTGNDSTGNGTSGNPWLTRQYAWNYILNNLDLAGYTVTVQIANGTYTANFNPVGMAVGQKSYGQIIFNGNSATPSNVVMNPSSSACFSGVNCAYQIQNMLLENANNDCIDTSNNGIVEVGAGIIFGSAPNGCHMRTASPGASIIINDSYTISGGAQAHYQSQCTGSQIDIQSGVNVAITGMPAFSQAFAVVVGGNIFFQSTPATFSGSATGTRYSATLGGTIQTQGSGASYLPGNAAGSSPTGYYA